MLKRSTKLFMYQEFVLKKINLNIGNVSMVPTTIINIRCYYSKCEKAKLDSAKKTVLFARFKWDH